MSRLFENLILRAIWRLTAGGPEFRLNFQATCPAKPVMGSCVLRFSCSASYILRFYYSPFAAARLTVALRRRQGRRPALLPPSPPSARPQALARAADSALRGSGRCRGIIPLRFSYRFESNFV